MGSTSGAGGTPEIESLRKKTTRGLPLGTLPRPDPKGLPDSPELVYGITGGCEVQ